jgi:hypothetical protein
MTDKTQIPPSPGPGYKFMKKGVPTPAKPGGLFPTVPGHARGKDGMSN